MLRVWIEPMGVELRGAGTDESPHCDNRLDEVPRFHGDSIRLLHRLRPIDGQADHASAASSSGTAAQSSFTNNIRTSGTPNGTGRSPAFSPRQRLPRTDHRDHGQSEQAQGMK